MRGHCPHSLAGPEEGKQEKPGNPTSGHVPKGRERGVSKGCLHPAFTAARPTRPSPDAGRPAAVGSVDASGTNGPREFRHRLSVEATGGHGAGWDQPVAEGRTRVRAAVSVTWGQSQRRKETWPLCVPGAGGGAGASGDSGGQSRRGRGPGRPRGAR